jgi:hypothetical protein
MFLRFAVTERHPRSHWWKGVFSAIADLQDSGRLSVDESRYVEEQLDWFSSVLPFPTCFSRPESRRGICWFTPNAGAVVTRMWKLVRVLEVNGKPVRLHKTHDPGLRIYRDAFQVVAVPQGQQRVRVTR